MSRPLRTCPLCHNTDDHPRHEIIGLPENTAPHMDCCRTYGCPDSTCDIVTAGAEDLRGEQLREHLQHPRKQAARKRKLNARTPDQRHFTLRDVVHLGAVVPDGYPL